MLQPESKVDYLITWRGTEIGLLLVSNVDMWYLEGKWQSNGSVPAGEFETLAATFNARTVMGNPSTGTRVILTHINGEEPTHALILSLSDDLIYIRRVFEQKAVKWLIKNVR